MDKLNYTKRNKNVVYIYILPGGKSEAYKLAERLGIIFRWYPTIFFKSISYHL